jgi:aminocarboxymuconate-semialdehyde decarboxylase
VPRSSKRAPIGSPAPARCRYPGLRLCVAHSGGYAGRMDHAWSAREDCRRDLPRRSSDYLARIYYDTVVHSAEQLDYLVQRYGASQLLLGTDYPFDMGEPDPVGLLDRASGLTDADRAAIAYGNARRLLGQRLPG